MAWDPNEEGNPAWLTKQASVHGGVNNFIDDIHNEGYQEGHEDGVIECAEVATIIICIGFAAYHGIKHFVQKHQSRKKSIQEQAESSKAALKQLCEESSDDLGIKEE